MKLTAPKGTKDILPNEIYKWQYVEKLFFEICTLHGYSEIRIPTFESTELFNRGVGDSTDVVQKEMYTFSDKGNRSITLRPEGTAGVARSFIENGMSNLPYPVKLFYNITAFRYENVQKGRYREFHQLGAEAFGAVGPQVDAEIISLLDLYFRSLGINNSMLKINSIGCPICRKEYDKLLKAYLKQRYTNLCELCKERYTKNPLRVLDCKEKNCETLILDAPLLADHLCSDCKEHFEGLKSALDNLEIAYEVDKRIVRGLDYYTRTVFEFISDNVGTQGTICGGGRYDGLLSQLGGGEVPGIGFALGVERLLLELEAIGFGFETAPKPSVYIAGIGDEGIKVANKICKDIRVTGVRAETELVGRSFKAGMKYASKAGFSHLVIIGDDELETGKVKIKRLSDGNETVSNIKDIAQTLKE